MVKEQPSRRKSIAITDQNRPSVAAKGKRRAHSIVPGDILSPRAKARRLAAPRKSILKATLNLVNLNGSEPLEAYQGMPQSQPSSAPSSSPAENNATQSMNLTTELQTQIHDNASRKSLGRRVSFAKNAHNNENTNSTASPEASPIASSDPVNDDNVPRPVVLSNENVYPGASMRNRRRSSVRQSMGSEDMDLTVTGADAFLYARADRSALADEEMEFEDDSMDMDMTEDLDMELIKRRSVSLGGARKPLAQISAATPSATPNDADQSQSFTDQSQSYSSDQSHEQPTEFTIPINHSLRPPPTEDAAWMALRRMTHSGDIPYEDPPPSSDDEYVPLAGGNLLPNSTAAAVNIQRDDPSFSSADDSFSDANNDDRTMNLTKVIGRVSLAADHRISVGHADSTMDESEVYGSIIAHPAQSTPVQQHPRTTESRPEATRPLIFRPPSPSKNVTSHSASTGDNGPIFIPPSVNEAPSPSKRPRERDSQTEKPSPAKRLAVAGRWSSANSATDAQTLQQSAAGSKPRPLSPSKKAPFLVPMKTSTTSSALPRPPSALRRPSGYFARRKSMGTELGAVDAPDTGSGSATLLPAAPKSPKKKPGIGMGRASMGSAPSDAWKRFDTSDKGKEKRKAPDNEHAAADSLPSTGSPAPASQPVSPRPVGSPSPVFDLSTMLDTESELGETVANMEVDPTEQWRNGVQEAEPPDQDVQPISIEQFFEITDVKFMDELDAPRRSMHQPSRQGRPHSEIPLAEYAIAVSINVPELALYSTVSSELQAWMEQSKAMHIQAEEEAAKMTPQLFTEYIRAEEEDQAALLHQLNLIRIHARGQAKSEWYDWKLQWIGNLRETADKGLQELREDALVMEQLRTLPDEILPALEREYEEVMLELEQEQAEVAEIESCDADYLNELKASIAEQNTHAELSRLKGIVFSHLASELHNLQDLHMFRATKVLPGAFEYEYANQFRVEIQCRNFVPLSSQVRISRLDRSRSVPDDFPVLSSYFLENAPRQVPSGMGVTTSQIVQSLSSYWSACGQVRSQLFQLTIKYPVDVEILPPGQGFRAKTTVMFRTVRAKAFIYFIFSLDTFSRWPMSIGFLRHEVEVAYGAIEQAAVSKAVAERLDQASPADNYGCLLDACIGAQELY
ncbi:Spc7 kinetochore protein-domain-containing protein [Mycena pura]|uniref:Spc7 kinetochore protein-domain-containing protein n=1 Tax=Mycena pura TaxID=153505 RepID=A0AAD6YQ50_9AGAR|nr:Spc7 kinetochore protein-domain-containing protein [Mycena pura]